MNNFGWKSRAIFFLISSLFILHFSFFIRNTFVFLWSAWMDSNHRPHAYQACALATWATGRRLTYRSSFVPQDHAAFPAGGDEGARTPDPLLAKQVLSQLSYTPIREIFISNSHWKPNNKSLSTRCKHFHSSISFLWFSLLRIRINHSQVSIHVLHRKEVIQPHRPIRLPCYDLTPIIEPTFDSCLLAVSSLASGVPDFHGLTGGVYKARERIHRGMLIRDY